MIDVDKTRAVLEQIALSKDPVALVAYFNMELSLSTYPM